MLCEDAGRACFKRIVNMLCEDAGRACFKRIVKFCFGSVYDFLS